jgi:hypothetical protein
VTLGEHGGDEQGGQEGGSEGEAKGQGNDPKYEWNYAGKEPEPDDVDKTAVRLW